MSVDHGQRTVRCTRCGQEASWARELDVGWPESWSAWYAFRSQGVYLAGDTIIEPQFLLCDRCSGEAYGFFMAPVAHGEGSGG